VVVEEMKAADNQLRKLAGEHEVCRRLMTVPDIGPVTALRFVAAIDEPGRFATAHRVQSYLGLTPGEHSSSDRDFGPPREKHDGTMRDFRRGNDLLG